MLFFSLIPLFFSRAMSDFSQISAVIAKISNLQRSTATTLQHAVLRRCDVAKASPVFSCTLQRNTGPLWQ